MKQITFSKIGVLLALLLLCGILSSCKETVEDVVYPEWPYVSTPSVETASLKPVVAGQTEITAGSQVHFRATVADERNPIRQAKLVVKYGDKQAVGIDFRLNSQQVALDTVFVMPFNSALTADMYPTVTLEVTNKMYKIGSATLEPGDNTLVKRPVVGDKLYLVTSNDEVIELSKTEDNTYTSTVKTNYFASYKIAQKLNADHTIDYSGLVWGSVDGQIGIIGSASDSPIALEMNQASVIKKVTFSTVSFDPLFDLAIVFGGVELVAPSYNGYQECSIDLEKDQEYTVTGIGELNKSINATFLQYVSEDKVKFTGSTGRYNLYYKLDKSHLYIQQNGVTYPAAIWITGGGMGFPQQPYSVDIAWAWGEPHKFAYCKKTGEDKFEVVLYLSANFQFKPFQQKDWGNEWQSTAFTKTPKDVIIDHFESYDGGGHYTGDFKNGPVFTEGIYLLKFDMANKTLEAIKQ